MAEYALHFWVSRTDKFWSSKTYSRKADARKHAYELLSIMPKGAYARIYDYNKDLFIEALDVKDGKYRSSDEKSISVINPATGGKVKKFSYRD